MRTSTQAIFSLLKHNKRTYIVDAIIMLVANVAEALIALFFGFAIGAAAVGGNYQDALMYLAIGFGLNVVHMISWHTGDYWVIRRVYANTYSLREIAYEYIWKYNYSTFIELPSSKIAASANKLQESLKYLYDSFHYGFFSIGIYYATLTISIAAIAWQNVVVYIGFMLFAVLVLAKRAKKITASSAKFADKLAEVDGKSYDSVANYTNVFSFVAKDKELRSTSKNIWNLYAAHYKKDRTIIDFWVVAAVMVRVLLWASILSLNYYLLRTGQISQTGFAAAIAVLVSFTGQYWSLVHHISEFGSRLAAFRQNYDYLFLGRDVVKDYYLQTQASQSADVPRMHSRLEFLGVSFAYPDLPDKNVLDAVSFTVAAKEKIGIVGKSGGGKSTLVKLLLGFYTPNNGQIKVDGVAIDASVLSQMISYVPQDTTLFQQSVAYNIGYATTGDANRDDVVKAAKKAHAHDFIMQLKNGYDTLVGERGVKLSLGQRQRIALARAFLRNTDLLILDEATSSLDSKTEKDIQDSLEQLWKDKTVIAIAHRLSTLNNVDRILVVDGGKIIESGTKDELLKLNGLFAELWNHQKNGLI
jgi:ABC-type multidrug transport system fused ATPase/permease subunit